MRDELLALALELDQLVDDLHALVAQLVPVCVYVYVRIIYIYIYVYIYIYIYI